jgi:hypothetical protein
MREGFVPGLVVGVGVGVGLALLAPALLAGRKNGVAAGAAARPLAKQLVRTGLGAFERVKESLGEVGEMAEDLVAEVKAEMILEQTQKAAAARAQASEEK